MNKKGFTLAEVLITLGIIGVIAIMTIPQLLNHFQRVEVENRLKHTYALFYQAMQKAEVKYGEPDGWGFDSVIDKISTGGNNGEPNDKESAKAECIRFFNEILKPNLKIALDYGYGNRHAGKSSSVVDYEFRNPKTKEIVKFGYDNGYWFSLENGALGEIFYGDYCVEPEDITDEDGNVIGTSCPKGVRKYNSMIVAVDVNGYQKPNTLGKDLFLMQYELDSGNFNMRKDTDSEEARESNLKNYYIERCKNSPQYCGRLIQIDGWKISPKDYPWWKKKWI